MVVNTLSEGREYSPSAGRSDVVVESIKFRKLLMIQSLFCRGYTGRGFQLVRLLFAVTAPFTEFQVKTLKVHGNYGEGVGPFLGRKGTQNVWVPCADLKSRRIKFHVDGHLVDIYLNVYMKRHYSLFHVAEMLLLENSIRRHEVWTSPLIQKRG